MELIGVIGAGQMGSGIAQVCAAAGYRVVMQDLKPEFIERGRQAIGASLERMIKKGTLASDERDQIMERIHSTTQIAEVAKCALVIEAATEDRQIKFELFRQLDAICQPTTLLASNTSSISITEIGAQTKRPAQVIGMHFFNPVPIMSLVEIVRSLETSDETFATVRDLATALGKTPVEVNDFPGFVSNRILIPMLNEAFYAVMEGVATPESIDTVMKLGMNHPMGPLQLADFIGLDTCLAIMEVLHRGLGDDKYRPCPLLRKMVAAGRLGRKSGHGFYRYDAR